MHDIGSASSHVPDDADASRIVWHDDFQYMRRDGVLYSKFLGVGEWGDALEQQREAWTGTPVEALFTEPRRTR